MGSHEWAAFQCQQAGEKALKALWLYQGLDPWGHSLIRLVNDFPEPKLQAQLQSLMQSARQLDKLYIPIRYPNGLPDLTPAEVYAEMDSRDAIHAAETVIDLVKSLIAPAEPGKPSPINV